MTAVRPTAEQAEEQMRRTLAEAGVPAPDEIRLTAGELRARWPDQHLAVAIAVDPGMPR
jgi:hypothetical protein